MDGRPKAAYDPFLAPSMPPLPPIGSSIGGLNDAPASSLDPKLFSAGGIMARDSSLPSINSLMRVPTTTASPIASYSPQHHHHPHHHHLAAAQQQLGMYQPYSTLPASGVGAAPLPGYQGLPVVPPTGVLPSPLQPLSSVASSSESPQIYDLDKNFHLNAPVPQYPPGGVAGLAAGGSGSVPGAPEIPPPGYGGHYHHQRPPMYGNYHPTSSYNSYGDDYYLASTYNNYTDYGTPMGYQAVAAAPGAADPTHGSILQPLGQQVTQLQPVSNQQAPSGSMVTTLSSANGQQPIEDASAVATTGASGGGGGSGKKSGSSGGGGGGSSSGSEKKTEKKPTMSSMARYVCAHCDGKEFVSLPVISKHIRQHNLHLCNLCVRTFEHTDDLKSHECRPKGSNVSYPKCPICLKYLSNSWSLSRHMKTHNRDQSGGVSKDLSSSSDIKSSESEESSNAKLDLEGSAMDCDDLSKDMGMLSRSGGAGDDMELELDGHESMGSQHLHAEGDTSSASAMQEMMLKSNPRVMLEKLSFSHFTNNSSSNHKGLDTSSDGGKTSDDEGLVDEKTKKEQSADVPLEKCIVCGKEFKNRTYLYKHLKSVHTAKILKSPSEGNSPPGSPLLKGSGDELDNCNAPVKSSVARALASKLSRKQQQLNGKADDDPRSTDSNNNGSNGGDYLVPLTSSNANQININTSGNSITIISNVTYCNTAHEVPITTSTSGPNGGTPVTTVSEATPTSAVGGGGGTGATTTVAGSNRTTPSGAGTVIGDGRRLSGGGVEATNGKMIKEEYKAESTCDGTLDPVTGIKHEHPQDCSLEQDDVLDKMGNKLLEPPPFIIQKVKQDVVVVTGSETTIVQPNLVNSDAMMGKMQQPYEPATAVVKSEPQDPFSSKPQTAEDPYAFNVDAMESHFGPLGGGPQSQPQSQVAQMHQQQQQQQGNGPPMHLPTAFDPLPQQQQAASQQSVQQSHQLQSNPSQLDQNHHTSQQQLQTSGSSSTSSSSNNTSNFYGAPPQQQPQHHLSDGQHMQQQFMNPPPPHQQQQMQQSHPHMQGGYDPMQQLPQHQSHHMVATSSAPGMNYPIPSTSTPILSYPHHSQTPVGGQPLTNQSQLPGDMLAIPQQPISQIDHQLGGLGGGGSQSHLENNPPSQQTSIDNSADFEGDPGAEGEQESFQSGGDGAADDGEVKTQICDECGKSFAKRSQLTRHKNIHKNIIYICPFCQREPFKARNSLKNHLKTNHKDMKDKWEDPAYISAQVIKEPEKVDEYMRNWNEKTKPGLNTKGGGAAKEEKHPVDMLESMNNSMPMGGGVGMPMGMVSEPPVTVTPKGKKKKGAKAKGAAAAAEPPIEGDVKISGNPALNGPPIKVEPVGAPDYYNGVPAAAAPMHHQHYGGHNPYPNAYQPPYMGQPPGAMGEYGQLPPSGMDHHHMQPQQPPPPPPPHHHQQQQQGGGGLYQTPGAYQGQHLMGPGGAGQSPYGQPYPPPHPVGQQQQQPQHGHGPAPPPPGPPSAANSQYGGGHTKSSNSVPASPLRSSIQSPMSPPVSPHPQQFYQHQLPPGHHYYGAGGGGGGSGAGSASGPQQPPANPYRSTSALSSRQSPAPFSPHMQQPQRTQSTDSASSAVSASAAAANSGSALVTNQYGPQGAYHPHHHHQAQQQYPPPPHQYGPPQGSAQAPAATPAMYGGGAGQSATSGSNAGGAAVGPVPPTPPPSASSFSSNASTSSTSSNSSAYGQQPQSSAPSLHHHHHQQQQQQQHHQSSYHSSAYDGQQPPPSKRPRYYQPSGPSGPPPPPPSQQQPQNHHQVQQQQYYGAHHYHMPPNGGVGGAPAAGGGGSHHQNMYNGMQPPPPSASLQGPPSGQNMGAPGYQ